jgi:hypothetical protein
LSFCNKGLVSETHALFQRKNGSAGAQQDSCCRVPSATRALLQRLAHAHEEKIGRLPSSPSNGY